MGVGGWSQVDGAAARWYINARFRGEGIRGSAASDSNPPSDRPGGRMKRFVRLLAGVVVAVLGGSAAMAQSSGGLNVRVIDNADKAAVIGAAVTLSNTNKYVATSTTLTDKDGVALFPVLRPGAGYVVVVIMDGYAGIKQDTNVAIGTIKDVVIAL